MKESSQGWHEGNHDPWPYLGYLLYILKKAYDEFVERVGTFDSPKGEKTEMIDRFLQQSVGEFTVGDMQRACPEVSLDLIRRILKARKSTGQVECLGMGRNARWRKM